MIRQSLTISQEYKHDETDEILKRVQNDNVFKNSKGGVRIFVLL